jgi:hypothetical protein
VRSGLYACGWRIFQKAPCEGWTAPPAFGEPGALAVQTAKPYVPKPTLAESVDAALRAGDAVSGTFRWS